MVLAQRFGVIYLAETEMKVFKERKIKKSQDLKVLDFSAVKIETDQIYVFD